MSTALDDIEAAAGALNALTVQEAAEKARIDAAVAAALKAIVAPVCPVYVDQVAGLDTNDGTTPQSAVKTLNAASALAGAGQVCQVQLLSDVALTAPLAFLNEALSIASYGINRVGQGGAFRTLSIAPSAALGDGTGRKNALTSAAGGKLYLLNVNLAIGAFDATTTGVMKPEGGFYIGRSVVTFDPALAAPLFDQPDTPTRYYFTATTLPSGYGGKLFAGVPAGANPNSFTVMSSLTSA